MIQRSDKRLYDDPSVRRRWRELVMKQALLSITPEEAAKLDRYQALLRPRRTSEEVRSEALNGFKTRRLLKELRRLQWESSSLSTDVQKDAFKDQRE